MKFRYVKQIKAPTHHTLIHTDTHFITSSLTSPSCWLFRQCEKRAQLQPDLRSPSSLSSCVLNCWGYTESQTFQLQLTLSSTNSDLRAKEAMESHINPWQVMLASCYQKNCDLFLGGKVFCCKFSFQCTLCELKNVSILRNKGLKKNQQNFGSVNIQDP